MAKPTDVRVVHLERHFPQLEYRSPMKFGGRVVTAATLLEVTLDVETRDGRRGRGFGSMPLGNIWAWPAGRVTPEQSLAAMSRLGERYAEHVRNQAAIGHPLQLTRQLSEALPKLAVAVIEELALPEPMPRLAQMVVASPVEAAIHDAYGKALGENTYNLLGREFVSEDLSSELGPEFAGEFLDAYTLREPKSRMPLYHLVGALDPLTPGEVASPVGDGLPESLGAWIVRDELTHLKIKLNGDDLAWDVGRVLAVEEVAVAAQQDCGCKDWHYSVDFNERCKDVQYVLDFLGHVRERSPGAYDRIQYIEQPTSRDLRANPENRMHAAARLRPVVIDEALVDLESLLLCREQGYSGVALKACKGQTEALLMGAAAQKFGMFLCIQDLTCPGASFLQSATLASRIPSVAAIEGNARQYCPAGNRGWQTRFPTMFELRKGTVDTSVLVGPGLGY